ALAEALRYLGRDSTDLVHVASVDPDGDVAPHRAHAEYAVAASGFGDAVVLVCDAEVSAWRARPSAEGPRLDRLPGDFDAFRIAPRYAELTARLGLRPRRDEHLVEAMARAGHEDAVPTQHRLGDELLRLLDQVRSLTDCDHLCLS